MRAEFAFVTFIFIGLNVGLTSGNCNFPQSWVERGKMITNTKENMTIFQFVSDDLKMMTWMGEDKFTAIPNYCHVASGNQSHIRLTLNLKKLPVKYRCFFMTVGERNKAVIGHIHPNMTGTTLEECKSPYDRYGFAILVPDSIQIEDSTTQEMFSAIQNLASDAETPLLEGTYQTEILDASGKVCENDESPVVEIKGNKLMLKSCKAEYQMNLTWVDNFSPEGYETAGSLAFLIDFNEPTPGNLSPKLYCARYKMEGNSFKMSVETDTLTQAICLGEMTYETVNDDTFAISITVSGGAIFCPTLLLIFIGSSLLVIY